MASDDDDLDEGAAEAPANVPADDRPQDRFKAWLRPKLHQVWVNIRVWAPFLLNPFDRQRIVRYGSRERREGLAWKVGLPQKCWECGATEGIESHRWNRSVRNFDHPLVIFAITLAILMFLTLMFWLTGASYLARFFFFLMVVAGGGVMAWVKSWPEKVRITLFSCEKHRDATTRPDVAIFDEELYVFVPNPSLAETAQEELQAERRRGARRGTPKVGPTAPAAEDRDAGQRPRIAATQSPAPELPPIKLDDSEPADNEQDDRESDNGEPVDRKPAIGASEIPVASRAAASDLPAIKLHDDEAPPIKTASAKTAPTAQSSGERERPTKRELPPITFDDDLPASGSENRTTAEDELPPITLDDE